jgi:hypothetical protein
MSEPIETGARRRVRTLSQPRAEAVDQRRSIDRAKDELDLGRFAGKAGDAAPTTLAATDELELGRFTGRSGDEPRPKAPARTDEMELGRFTGKVGDETERTQAKTPSAPDRDEVLGPKRQKVVSDQAKAQRRKVSAEMEIASSRDLKDEGRPSASAPKQRRTSSRANGRWSRRVGLLAVSVVLTVLTAAVFLLMPRYQPVGDPLIADPAFAPGLADWQYEGLISWDPADPSRVTLERINANANTFLTRDIVLPPGDNLLILRARVQADDVVPGPEVWEQARVYLAQLTAGGDVKWDEEHNLFLLNGSTELRNYSRAYSIPEEIRTLRLGIEMKNATGRMTIHSLHLGAAERPAAFLAAAGCLLLAWGLLVPYAAYRTLRGIESRRIRIALCVACVLSVIGLLLPGFLYEDGLKEVASGLGFQSLDVDPIGHGLIFSMLPFLVRLGRPSEPIWLHAGAWFLIGVASEVLQLFTVDREPSFDDLALDAVAVLVGLALAELVMRVPRSAKA